MLPGNFAKLYELPKWNNLYCKRKTLNVAKFKAKFSLNVLRRLFNTWKRCTFYTTLLNYRRIRIGGIWPVCSVIFEFLVAEIDMLHVQVQGSLGLVSFWSSLLLTHVLAHQFCIWTSQYELLISDSNKSLKTNLQLRRMLFDIHAKIAHWVLHQSARHHHWYFSFQQPIPILL